MSLTARQQLLYWSVGLVGLLVLMYLLADTLFPFIVSGAIAYLLDPVADRLERLLRSRIAATAILLLLIFLAIIGVILIVTPILVYQFTALSDAIPSSLSSCVHSSRVAFPRCLNQAFSKHRSFGCWGIFAESKWVTDGRRIRICARRSGSGDFCSGCSCGHLLPVAGLGQDGREARQLFAA